MNWPKIINKANQDSGYPPQRHVPQLDEDFDKLVYETFSTTYGKELLKFLDENFLREPLWEPGNQLENCYFMEGRNNLVRLFIDRKKAYKRNNT